MEETKVLDVYVELPDGYEVQLMVLRDFPGGRAKRGLRMNIFRSRVWIGHMDEAEPLLYRSQEHPDMRIAMDACYSILLATARSAVNSPAALEAIQQHVYQYFGGTTLPNGATQAI